MGNKGGGCRTGRKYAEQVTAGLTEAHFNYLKRLIWRNPGTSLADALRYCIEACMDEAGVPLDGAERAADASYAARRQHAG
jgi:hypothetical protein